MATMPPQAQPGSWIWYELMTPDPEAAKSFYEAVVGWTVTTPCLRTSGYGFIHSSDGGKTAGLLGLSKTVMASGTGPAWLGAIAVADCDAALRNVRTSGGQVLMPALDVPGAGRVALVADCCGHPFYVMAPERPEGQGDIPFSPTKLGRCAWNELHASDRSASLAFYTRLFGWGLPPAVDMGVFGPYQYVSHGDVPVGAIMQETPQVSAGGWNFYFRVADIDTATAAVKAHGGRVVHGPVESPSGDWIINGVDPQGAAFALVGNRRH